MVDRNKLESENIKDVKNSTLNGLNHVRYVKWCYGCGREFTAVRSDALTCSDNCAQRVKRRLRKGLLPVISAKIGQKKTTE